MLSLHVEIQDEVVSGPIQQTLSKGEFRKYFNFNNIEIDSWGVALNAIKELHCCVPFTYSRLKTAWFMIICHIGALVVLYAACLEFLIQDGKGFFLLKKVLF